MYDSLRVLVVSNMVPSTEVPQYGVFVMRQTAALEQAGCTVEVVGIEQRTTGLPGTLRKYVRLRSQGAHAADRMQADVVLGHYLVPTALIARRVARSVGAPYVLVAHGGDVGHLERSRPLRTESRTMASASSESRGRNQKCARTAPSTLPARPPIAPSTVFFGETAS